MHLFIPSLSAVHDHANETVLPSAHLPNANFSKLNKQKKIKLDT